MKEAELFRQYAKEAMRWSSRKIHERECEAGTNQPRARYAQAALMSEGIVLGSSFIPSPRYQTLEEAHPVF
jgi:hypothetical protein